MAEMLWKPVVLLGDGRDMNCKAVVFDMDGVILDSEQLVVKSWQKTADKYGIEDIESFCMAALGLNREAAKKLFVQMYKGRCDEGQDTLDEERYESLKVEMAAEFHRAAAEGELVLKPGVTDMLKMLRDNGMCPCHIHQKRGSHHGAHQPRGDRLLRQACMWRHGRSEQTRTGYIPEGL